MSIKAEIIKYAIDNIDVLIDKYKSSSFVIDNDTIDIKGVGGFSFDNAIYYKFLVLVNGIVKYKIMYNSPNQQFIIRNIRKYQPFSIGEIVQHITYLTTHYVINVEQHFQYQSDWGVVVGKSEIDKETSSFGMIDSGYFRKNRQKGLKVSLLL